MKAGKNTTIRYQGELVQEFADLVANDNRIEGFKLDSHQNPRIAALSFDGQKYRFQLNFVVTPTTDDIPPPSSSLVEPKPLLVVPRLTPAFLDACRQNQACVADLNGQLYLRAPGLLISLPALPHRNIRFELEPRNVFVGKSVRIVRSLLADPERVWRQADLLERTGATSGLVSRIVTHLQRQGLLKKVDARRFHVVTPSLLLDAWAQADDFSRRAITHRFTTLEQDPVRIAKRLRNVLTHHGPHFAFTQWIAAWLRHPYTEPPVVSLYVPQLPAQTILDELGLRPVSEAGRVWFHLPADEGVFRETRVVQDLPLVSDAQIYIDLLKTGLRGPEQAEALREWSGFLKP
jgi:hypothetical protein